MGVKHEGEKPHEEHLYTIITRFSNKIQVNVETLGARRHANDQVIRAILGLKIREFEPGNKIGILNPPLFSKHNVEPARLPKRKSTLGSCTC